MNRTLRVLLVDDEPPARRWLREILSVHPVIQIAGEAGDIPAAIAMAARLDPDVVFLDVQMPPHEGFDLLRHLGAHTRVVFVTAHEVHAIRAFEANALDYLLKPVSPERMGETLRRLLTPSPETPPAALGPLASDDLVTLRDSDTFRLAPVLSIAAIRAEGAYSRVLLQDAPSMLILRPIGEWERRLPTPPFARLDRSLLINLASVRAFHVHSRKEGRLEFAGTADPTTLGRTASLRLRHLLKESADGNLSLEK